MLETGRKRGDIDGLKARLLDLSRSVGDRGEMGVRVTVAPVGISDDGEAEFESLAEGIPGVHQSISSVFCRLGWRILRYLRGERSIANLDQVSEHADRLQLDWLKIVGEGDRFVRVLVITCSEPHA